jgi:uncharacterized protein (TIGR03437 family)
VAVDGAGNLIIADGSRIRRVSPSGIITTVAGDGTFSRIHVDGESATSAPLSAVTAIAVDSAGNLFILDNGRGVIRKVSVDGIITTVAGDGVPCCASSGDGGPATSAHLRFPAGIAVDGAGNMFIAEGGDNHGGRVRKVSPSGIISTVAGNGNAPDPGCRGDGGRATEACLEATGVAVDVAGNLYVADGWSGLVRKVSLSGIITTMAGNGLCHQPLCAPKGSGDSGPATELPLGAVRSIAVDGAGNLFIVDPYAYTAPARLRKVTSDGMINTVAGNDYTCCFSGDGGPATSAHLNGPSGVAVDGAGNVFIADGGNQRVRKVSPDGTINTVAGNGTYCYGSNCPPNGDGGPATSARLLGTLGVAVDGRGNLFIPGDNRVRKVSPDGIITTVAGNGTDGSSGDGGPATSAQVRATYVTADNTGNLFIAECNRIRKVSSDGLMTTVAGNGISGFSGDGGPATGARLNTCDTDDGDGWPGGGMAVDGAGDVFFADTFNGGVRQISRDGTINSVNISNLGEPFGVAFDGAGNLFVEMCGGTGGCATKRILKVTPNGVTSNVAGYGNTVGYSGDGGPAASATLGFVTGVAVDGAGNIYVADPFDNAVRVLRPAKSSVLIGTVVDAASQRADPISPGKIVVIYGGGLGPDQLVQNQASNGQFGTELSGTKVSFNGTAAPILYASAMQVAVVVPYGVTGTSAQVTVTYQGQLSNAVTVPVSSSAPSLFTLNQTGAGQAAAINADGTANTATKPVKIGGFISLYATGEGQTSPGGVDGKVGGSTPVHPVLPVSVTVGGIPATVQYFGSLQGQVAGLMQVNVQIPNGVQPGGYVPVVLKVGDASTTDGAVWIAVAGN